MNDELQPGTAVRLAIPTLPECRTGTVLAGQRCPVNSRERMYRVLTMGQPTWVMVHEKFISRDADLAAAVRGFRML